MTEYDVAGLIRRLRERLDTIERIAQQELARLARVAEEVTDVPMSVVTVIADEPDQVSMFDDEEV